VKTELAPLTLPVPN